MIVSQLFEAFLRLRSEGMEPSRIEINKNTCERLMREVGFELDPRWNPVDGSCVGKFADVSVFINMKEDIFNVIGAYL